MPAPSSLTVTRIAPSPSGAAEIATAGPPAAPNFTALDTRFCSTSRTSAGRGSTAVPGGADLHGVGHLFLRREPRVGGAGQYRGAGGHVDRDGRAVLVDQAGQVAD